MKIESAQHLWAIHSALEFFASQRVPFGILLQLRRWRNEITEIHEALQQDIQPLLEAAGGSIGPSSDGWEEFVEGAEELFEPVTVDLDPMPLESLEALAERPDFVMPTGLFEVLIRAGIVQED